MEQLINNMLANAQMPQIPQVGKKSEGVQKDGFQKLLEQKQSADAQAAPKPEKTDAAQKPQDAQTSESAKEPQEIEQPQQPQAGMKEGKELEEQMILAAMAMLQNPVVPAEQAEMTPEVQAEAVVEEIAPLMAETVLAPEEQSFVPEAGQTVEAAPESGEAQTVDPDLAQELPQTIEAPEAAQETEGRTVEIEARTADRAEPQAAEAADTEETAEPQGAEAETAVFEEVEAVPVKVGEAPKARESEPPMEEQIAPKLAQALREGETRVEIQLTPENLGKITVEMTQGRDGGLVVQIHAEDRGTQELLGKHTTNLAEMLGRETEQEVRVEVPRQEESQRQDLYDQQQGQRQRRQQEQRREPETSSEDFLQQLRLGLIPLEGE